MELTKRTDTPTTGLETRRWFDFGLHGLEVAWIAWDSPFRETGLRVGDVLTAVQGRPVGRGPEEIGPDHGPGGHAETAFWTRAGLRPGDAVALEVWRDGERLTVSAPLGAESFHSTAEGRRALGPGGPDRMASDGFQGSWGQWYEERSKAWGIILGNGWRSSLFNNRLELDRHLAEEKRVRHVAERFPGPFADRLVEDWERVAENLRGTRWPDDAVDLSYRTHREQVAGRVAEAAQEAEAAFREKVAGRLRDTFPAPDPFDPSLEQLAGSVVALDGLTPRSMRMDAGHPWYVAGDRQRGWYFLDAESLAVRRFGDALLDYLTLVAPSLSERYRFYAEILPAPRMLTVDGDAREGVNLKLLAALAGDAMFVEIGDPATVSHFAGREHALGAASSTLPDGAAPEVVLAAAFEAIKWGRQDVWKALFADWYAAWNSDGSVSFLPMVSPSGFDARSAWEGARRELLSDVYDVKVVKTGPVHRLFDPDRDAGAPLLEECRCEVEHAGRFDGEYRSFKRSRQHRVWVLQRIDGGPWRIRDVRGL